jgi:hypothetical protein
MKLIVMLGLVSGFANAATVTVNAGLPGQGYTVWVAGVPPHDFYLAAGSWDTATSTWTQFGLAWLDAGRIGGVATATGPISLNGQIIDIFVGSGPDIASSGAFWVILRHTYASLFPADITAATDVHWSATTTNSVSIVAAGDPANGFAGPVGATGGLLNLVPEPSVALLGTLGVLVTLRRRRG